MTQPPKLPPEASPQIPPAPAQVPAPPNVATAAPQGKPATPVRMRRNRPTGGTTLQEEGHSSWIWAALLLVAGIAIIVIFSTRGGDKNTPESNSALSVETEDSEDDETSSDPTTESAAVAEPAVAPVARVDAMAMLGDELNRLELWSELELQDDNVTIRATTAYCEDDKFKAAVQEYRASLRKEGVVALHCYARYGKLMFEQGL